MRTITAKTKGNVPTQKASSDPLSRYAELNLCFIKDLFSALLSDFVNLNPSYRSVDSARDLATIHRRLDNEGLGFLSKTLPSLMASLFLKIEGGVPDYSGFHTRCGIPVFLNRLFHQVIEDGEDKEVSFSQIYQICTVFKKLRGPFKESVLVEEFNKFIETDQQIGFIDYNSDPLKPIIDNARKLIEAVLKDVELTPGVLKPRPGPGATNTPVDKHLRFLPHVVYTELDETFDYLENFYFHSWDPVEDARRYMGLPHADEAISRHKFIQKYLGKPRGICIEENEMQFFQQALKRLLYKVIESHPATRGRVNFTSQLVNRDLAFESSLTRRKVTIDMSEASNRVARELVTRLTWGTSLFHQLDAVSTRLLLTPNDTIYKTHMFAPMGSGVCFPVMALVHWALIRSIIKLSSIADSEKLSKEVYVYGDDIIVPVEAAKAVYDYLPLFGMKINKDKSFVHSFFRESCGIHAYNGVDVTPVYVNHVINKEVLPNNTTVLLSLVAKEYGFYSRSLFQTAKFIRESVQKTFWAMPFVGKDSPVLGFIRDGSTSARQIKSIARGVRYDQDTQQPAYSVQVVIPSFETEGELCEGSRYLRNRVSGPPPAATSQWVWNDLDQFKTDPKNFVPFRRELGSKVKMDVEHLSVRREWILESNL